jgi:signal transduction histidine kinase
MTNIFAISGLINALVALFFAVIVFLKGKKNITYQTVALLSMATAVWGLGYWQWQKALDYESALFWVRILSIGSSMIPVFYFHWVISILELNKKYSFFVRLAYVLGFIFLTLSFSPLFVAGLKPVLSFLYWPVPGIFYHFYLLFFYFTLTIFGLGLLFSNYKKKKGFKKEQIKYVIFASVVGFGGGFFNFFLWYGIPILPWGTFLVAVYPIIFTYSIIKHRLMDMVLVLKKSTIYLFSVLSIVLCVFLIRIFLLDLPQKLILLVDIVMISLGIIAYPYIRKFYNKIAKKYFFTDHYDRAEIFSELNDNLIGVNQPKEIYEIVLSIILNNFLTEGVAFLSLEESKKKYILEHQKGFVGENIQKEFASDGFLYKKFVLKNEPILVEEVIDSLLKTKKHEMAEIFKKKNIEIVIPVVFKKQVLGVLVLAQKKNLGIYNQEDIYILKTISNQLAISVQNAILFDEVRSFNSKLKQKVKEATTDLRNANKHLKELDRAKTEFLSIASHQLRTPMTGIKGCLSMLLEGDFGRLNKKQEKIVSDVYLNSERMVRMVNTFLDVTRIESGRLVLIEKEFDFVEMVERSFGTLKVEAENRNLKITLKKEKSEINVIADFDKLQDVVLNLIDNAIKYTEVGEIKVEVGKKGKNVFLKVQDSGIGLNEEERTSLFVKMKRGDQGLKMNTDGCGLGLFIVKKIVDIHHGTINVDSEGRGLGTSFEILIPVKQKK